MPTPRLLILGQLTVDDVVPASPGRWERRLGGNALYTLAGARTVMPEAEIGVVSRLGNGAPDGFGALLAGTSALASLSPSGTDQLVEWLIYEPDGSRRTLPRNVDLRGGETPEARHARYLDRLEAQSPRLADIPADWRAAPNIHCATQVWPRHEEALRDAPAATRLSLDPSRHYAAPLDLAALATRLVRADAVLPSEQEIAHLAPRGLEGSLAHDLVRSLVEAGLREVVLKLGARGCVVGTKGATHEIAGKAIDVVDPTGAGDAFCGAYAAARALGLPPNVAAERAVEAGALIVGRAGLEAALALPVMPAVMPAHRAL